VRRAYPTSRPYALRGLLSCGLCDRRMQGSWNNNQAYYRCRIPSQEPQPDQARGVYLREAAIVPPLHHRLASQQDQTRLPQATATAITAVAAAPAADRAALYAQFGLRLIYQPRQRTVHVRIEAMPASDEDPAIGPASWQGQLTVGGLACPQPTRSFLKTRRPLTIITSSTGAAPRQRALRVHANEAGVQPLP
jgi:hypothetical protein